MYEYHGSTETGRLPAAETTCSGVASGHGGPSAGTSEPAGSGGLAAM